MEEINILRKRRGLTEMKNKFLKFFKTKIVIFIFSSALFEFMPLLAKSYYFIAMEQHALKM